MISTAARLINQSKNTMDQYYAANEELNTRVHDASANLTTAGTNKEIKIKIAVNDATIDFLPSGSDFKVSYIVNSRVSGKDVICYWVPVTSP